MQDYFFSVLPETPHAKAQKKFTRVRKDKTRGKSSKSFSNRQGHLSILWSHLLSPPPFSSQSALVMRTLHSEHTVRFHAFLSWMPFLIWSFWNILSLFFKVQLKDLLPCLPYPLHQADKMFFTMYIHTLT